MNHCWKIYSLSHCSWRLGGAWVVSGWNFLSTDWCDRCCRLSALPCWFLLRGGGSHGPHWTLRSGSVHVDLNERSAQCGTFGCDSSCVSRQATGVLALRLFPQLSPARLAISARRAARLQSAVRPDTIRTGKNRQPALCVKRVGGLFPPLLIPYWSDVHLLHY